MARFTVRIVDAIQQTRLHHLQQRENVFGLERIQMPLELLDDIGGSVDFEDDALLDHGDAVTTGGLVHVRRGNHHCNPLAFD